MLAVVAVGATTVSTTTTITTHADLARGGVLGAGRSANLVGPMSLEAAPGGREATSSATVFAVIAVGMLLDVQGCQRRRETGGVRR